MRICAELNKKFYEVFIIMVNEIVKGVKYVGVNDYDVDLFEGQYKVPDGMAYNSYVVIDEKIAVFDTVDAKFGGEWLENVKTACEGKAPDYLIVQHMEPDHSANITEFLKVYPNAQVVSNAKAFTMMDNFFGAGAVKNRITVANGEVFDLGKHKFTFVFAPMVHWPEVMLTFDSTDGILFSADAFGKFGALGCEDDLKGDWACEARRYYFGIVGKYGMQVQNLLKQAANLDIKIICPLHGPVLKENLGYYVGLYNVWSSYQPESKGVFIAYSSVYGNTKKAAEILASELEAKGETVVISDLARADKAECVEDAFRYDRLVLASVTYNGDVFPCMRSFIEALVERGYKNRTVGFIENGSWAPMAKKVMSGMLENCKNLTFIPTSATVNSGVSESAKQALHQMAEELTSL